MKLKLLSYNICHGLGLDGVTDLKRTIEEIRQIGADLVGLQEVDRHFGERSDWQDQTAVLAEALGLNIVFAANLDMDPDPEFPEKRRQYGTAILSRFPITYSCNHPLPQIIVPGAWNEVRGVLEAHIEVDGTPIRLFNTHLGLTTEERTVQTEVLLRLIVDGKDRFAATFVTGDFNALPESPELTEILNVMKDSYAEVHQGGRIPTFMKPIQGKPTDVSCIDYIWCTPNVRVKEAETIRTFVSDHMPLTATIEL